MSELRINSWNELQDALFADSWREDLGRFRSPFVFRGHGDAAYPLNTALMRLGGRFVEMEVHLLRNFRKYAHRDVVERDTSWHWLSLAQHHGLPTRLLDWTMSPLVAAHFATDNLDQFDCDAAIWSVSHIQAHDLLPERLRSAIEGEGADLLTVEMLATVAYSLDEFDRLSQSPFVAFFEPPSMDERITNQFALFSILPGPDLLLDDWLAEHPELWRKIIIPAALKWEVRDKLDQANITERVLFPGLDGLSRWQKRYYSQRNASSYYTQRNT